MKPKKDDLKPVTPKKGRWKTILIVLLILGALSNCIAPTAEQDKPRGTLPSASVSGQVKTQPPASGPAETLGPTPTTAPTPEPTPELTPVPGPEAEPTPAPTPAGTTYVLNTNSHKFHYFYCSSADDIRASNRREYTGTREEVIAMGYSPCGRCHP